MKRIRRFFPVLFVVLVTATPAAAQTKPWCTQNPLLPNAQPYPAPVWSQLQGVPDYQNLSSNFVLTQNLKLLISTLEKAIAGIESGKSLAGAGEINGVCLCDCNQSAAYWVNFLGTTVKTEAKSALDEAIDDYIVRIENKTVAARKTVHDTIPNFKADVENIVRTTCDAMNTCSAKTGIKAKIYKDAGEVAQKQVEAIFLAALAQNGLADLEQEAKSLKADAADLLAKLAKDLFKGEFASPANLAKYRSLKDRVRALIAKAKTTVKDTAVLLATNLGPNAQKVVDAVLLDLKPKLDADAQTWATLEPKIRQAVDTRVQAIKTAVTDLYDTAVDRDQVFADFAKELEDGLLKSLSRIDGCYGVMKRAECTADLFCKGRPSGKKLFGNDDLELPLWTPTDIYKDPNTAVRWALSALGWLEKVKKVLRSESTSDATERLREMVKLLKNGQEILAGLEKYVDLYTDGYHQGAYSNLRAELTSCTAYAGSGLMAELFSTSGGDFRGGANYLSASLTKDHDVQFRSSGLAAYVNGRHIPLAPGVSLNAAVDGWKLFDRHYPFGIGRGESTSGWQFHPRQLGVFNLLRPDELEKICCKQPGDKDCITCPITGSSLLHKGFYPVQYTSGGVTRTWPRTGVSGEADERIAAVAGAGLNLELKMKTRYWTLAPIPVWIATITPWMSLDAGVGWRYEANHFRNTLRDQINKGLPAAAQLTNADFSRDTEAFQAPDASLDAGNRAEVKPKLGADVVLGFDLARFMRVGITASLYVGVDVGIEGAGGVVDLDRGLVDSLKDSNPAPKNCKPKLTEKNTRVCSNEYFKRNQGCAGLPEAQRKDCVDIDLRKDPAGAIWSTGSYKCEDGSCAKKGYCKEGNKVVLHDTTREQCEAAVVATPASCVATYTTGTTGGPEAVDAKLTVNGPPRGVAPWNGYGDAQIALAQAQASTATTKERCEALGWCINYKFAPAGTGDQTPYRGSFIGVAAHPDLCPAARYENGSPIVRADGRPVPSRFIRFEWRPGTEAPKASRRFFPYQCVTSSRPEVAGWEGTDCNPIVFGYPSACPGNTCTCTPGGAPCPAGQICLEGACVPKCTADAACGAERKCAGGGCVLANGVPYAEQVVFRMRNAKAPQHTVATYGLDKLVASVVAGVGVNVGIRYKLFKNWKEKNLFDDKWNFTIASFPGVKHQLGIESQYQGDCDPSGTVKNHQPDLVKRHAGNVTPTQLVQWCKPAMSADAQNPVEMPSVDETLGASVDATLKFGADVGLDYWARGQMCIGGKTWDQYFSWLEQNPAELWKKLRCSYTTAGGAVRPLPCSSGAELQTSLLLETGCLKASGPGARTLNAALLQVLGSSWLYPGTTSLDPRKLFIDDEGALERANVEPAVVSAAAASQFPLDAWLGALDTCVGDPNVDITLDLKPSDLQPCGGACCENGVCRQVASASECRGTFSPAAVCGAACPAVASQPATGSCYVFGRCQQVVSAADCQGSYFYAGKTCQEIPTSEPGCIPLIANETATWTFDEPKGPSTDLALYDNAATHLPGATIQPGLQGSALCFDGRSGYATVADHAEVDFNGGCPNAEPFTIAFWIRTKQSSGVVAVLDKRQAGPNFNRGWHIFLYNGRPGLQLGTGPGSLACAGATSTASSCTNEAAAVSVADGEWHFVAIRVAPRCGPDARGTFFVDGRIVSTFVPRPGELGNDAPLNIGRRDPAYGAIYFNGCLDELTLIKDGLSDYDLRALYYSGPRGKCRPKPCTLDAGMTAAANTYARRAVLAQTFTPSKSGYLTQIAHGLQTGPGAVAEYDLLITTTTSAGTPVWTGGAYTVPGVLYSATKLTSFAGGAAANGTVAIPAARRVLLQAGVRYALVLMPSAGTTGVMRWRGNSGASTYVPGSAYELAGSSWVVPSTGPKDHGFVVSGSCQ